MQISRDRLVIGNWLTPRINHIRVPAVSLKTICAPRTPRESGRINIQDRIALFVAETISESAADAQKPPSPQQTAQQQQQPSQQQQPPGGTVAGGIGGGDGTPAATPTSAGNVQQSQQAVPSATPTPTTANPHSTAGPPSSNQPSPHPSPLYPVIPQQASQPNGSTQGKPELQVSASRPLCCGDWTRIRMSASPIVIRRCANLRYGRSNVWIKKMTRSRAGHPPSNFESRDFYRSD